MYTSKTLHLFEINEEYKLFLTELSTQKVIENHKLIYGEDNYNIIWSININYNSLLFLNSLNLTTDSDGFYSALESYNLDEVKAVILNLNDSFDKFTNMFKDDITLPKCENIMMSSYLEKGGIKKVEKMSISGKKDNNLVNTNDILPGFSEDEFSNQYSNIDGTSLLGLNCEVIFNSECYIYYNNHFNQVVILNKKLTFEEISAFPELSYIICIEGNKDDMDNLKDTLNKNYFFNIEQLEGFIKFYKNDQNITEKKIKKCLLTNFDFTNDVEDRIRFTELYNNIMCLMAIESDKESKKILKQILPRILKELNLNKKRYKDGNYWYGIKVKALYDTKEHISDSTTMDKLIKEKESERDEINLSLPTLAERLKFKEMRQEGIHEEIKVLELNDKENPDEIESIFHKSNFVGQEEKPEETEILYHKNNFGGWDKKPYKSESNFHNNELNELNDKEKPDETKSFFDIFDKGLITKLGEEIINSMTNEQKNQISKLFFMKSKTKEDESFEMINDKNKK